MMTKARRQPRATKEENLPPPTFHLENVSIEGIGSVSTETANAAREIALTVRALADVLSETAKSLRGSPNACGLSISQPPNPN